MKPFTEIPGKAQRGLCVAYRCKNKKYNTDRFCHKHRKRYHKYNDPVAYTFNQKKGRAKERGIEWKLTLEQFRDFCEQTGYMEKKGRKATSASIDRINPNLGYEIGNLQILSLSDNSKKMHTDKSGCEDLPF